MKYLLNVIYYQYEDFLEKAVGVLTRSLWLRNDFYK